MLDDTTPFTVPGKRPHNWRTGTGLAASILVLSMLTGCGKPASITPNAAGNANMSVQVPPEIMATKELLDPGILASLPRVNPFINPLIKVEEEAPVDVTAEVVDVPPAPPPPDPFEKFKIGGIIYRRAKPMAIIKLGNEDHARIVKDGEVFQTEGSEDTGPLRVQVTQISKASISFEILDPPENYPPDYITREFKIPSLIGYGKEKNKESSEKKEKTDDKKSKDSNKAASEAPAKSETPKEQSAPPAESSSNTAPNGGKPSGG